LRERLSYSLDDGFVAVVIQILIILSAVTITLETVAWFEPYADIFVAIESALLVIFSVELVVRLIVSTDRFGYVFSFYGLVDIIAVVPALFGLNSQASRALRLLRLFKLARSPAVARAIVRYQEAWRAIRAEFIVAATASIVLLFVAAAGIYTFEHEAQPDSFSSIPECLWWALVTLTTVGYGDSYPVTVGGKLFASAVILVGIAIVAIPTSLLAAELMKTSNDYDRKSD